jgi:lipoprotein-releasing system ATP-binding protein
VTAQSTILKAKSIRKNYGQLEVLKGVDLEVNKGEIVALTGPSGAGKSTLLHLLGALDKPDQGSIELIGKDLAAMNESQLASFRNRHIGFVFQFHHLLPEFTALENILIPAMMYGTPMAESEKHALQLLEVLNVAHRKSHKPSELSGGEQQRVAVARALINRPELILADEPSGNLDSANAEELHKTFFRLREELGQTFVIVTHNQSLSAMADRTIRMKDGLVV